MEKKNLYHFWYSEQMDKVIYEEDFLPTNTCIIDGKVYDYTVCSNRGKDHGVLWNDIIYLGYGQINSVKGVQQSVNLDN